MYEKPRKPLSLTAREIVYLTDAVGNGDISQGLDDKDAHIAQGRRTLHLLMSVWNEVVTPTGLADCSLDIYVDEEMAWLLRSKVRSGDVDPQGQNIGLVLLRKIHTILLDFQADTEIPFDTLFSVELPDAFRTTADISTNSNSPSDGALNPV